MQRIQRPEGRRPCQLQRHGPGVGPAELPQLDGVFFGANQRAPASQARSAASKSAVVGQGGGLRQRRPGSRSMAKKPRAGQCRPRPRPARWPPARQRNCGAAVGAHGMRASARGRPPAAARRGLPSAHDQVHRAGPGLAQRAGGQQPAVAGAAVVEHADLDVARQRQVLQAVVADEHIHGRGAAQQARAASMRRCATNTGTPVPGDQQGFVAHFGAGCRAVTSRQPDAAAVAARHHAPCAALACRWRTMAITTGVLPAPPATTLPTTTTGTGMLAGANRPCGTARGAAPPARVQQRQGATTRPARQRPRRATRHAAVLRWPPQRCPARAEDWVAKVIWSGRRGARLP
jgi:hypothetical protein